MIEQVKKDSEIVTRSVQPEATLFPMKKAWPLILGPTGNETEMYCKFIIAPKKGTPAEIAQYYQTAAFRG